MKTSKITEMTEGAGNIENIENAENEEVTNQSNTLKELDLLEHFERIIELSRNSKLSEDFFQEASEHLLFIRNVLNISDVAIVFLAILLEESDNWSFSVATFGRHLDVGKIQVLRHQKVLNELKKKGLIKFRLFNGEERYIIPDTTKKALMEGRNIEQVDFSKFTTESFINYVHHLFMDKSQEMLTFDELAQDLSDLLIETEHLEVSSKVLDLELDTYDLNLFFAFIQVVVNRGEDTVSNQDLNIFFDSDIEFRTIFNSLRNRTNRLITEKWIEPVNNNGLRERFVYKMSRKAYKYLLEDLGVVEKVEAIENLISTTSLVSKPMFYNENERLQIEQLTAILHPDNFQHVQERLKESGMRTGFACLFHGVPGTGKTETAYQIAKNTCRDILPVNVTDIKSMWVGESESNIKAVFDHYRTLVKKSKLLPILLFNEADAILGARMEAKRSVEKMENAIQNIILQEMEDLEGIMIATTNLTKNLDGAFERRFLYKIEFNKPSLNAKKSIWRVMIPTLKPAQITSLANKYDFSGGQIENIARKCTVEHILTGKNPTTETLYKFCDNEQLTNREANRKVGFV